MLFAEHFFAGTVFVAPFQVTDPREMQREPDRNGVAFLGGLLVVSLSFRKAKAKEREREGKILSFLAASALFVTVIINSGHID